MKPIKPKIQNYYTQTGVGKDITSMWKYGAGNHRQTAYKIGIYHNNKLIHSTGKVMSDEQNNISLRLDLAEQTEYEFTVTVWDENDFSENSEKAKFITGVHNWRGEWIRNNAKKPFIARKRFNVNEKSNAVLSICVPGQFEVKINNTALFWTCAGGIPKRR